MLPVLLVSGGLAVAQELPDEEQILYIPQVVHGGGLETEFIMINLSESNRRVEIRTFGADGNPANLLRREASASEFASATSATGAELAPLGVASILSFSSSPSEVATGWAEITTTGSVALEVVFSARGPEGLLTSTSVLPTEASTAFSVIAFATQTLQTGLALLNPPSNAQTATVTVELVGSLGDVYSSVELSVPPGQTIPSQYVSELFPEVQDQEFFGSLDISSSQPVVAMPVRVEGVHFTTQLVHPARTTSAAAAAASSWSQITADSSMTSTRGLNAATTRTPLTANFVLVPSDHDGSPFAVQLHFSAPIDNKPRHVKQAFSVTGGSITKAKRLNPQWLSGKRVASQFELTVTPSGAGDVVLAAPGGRSCSAGSALCTPARQSLSHDLSATIRDGTASSHRPGQTSPPGRVRDLRAEFIGGADYLIFFRIPIEGDGALKYHILVGGCVPRARRITVRGWSRYFYRVIHAGTTLAGNPPRTAFFGVEGVNRNGTGPCVKVATVRTPLADLVVRSPTVSASSLETGESFSLSVTVGNEGAGNAAARTTLLYYRSTDGGTITGNTSDGDTEEGAERTDKQKEIGALFAGDTRRHQITLTAPAAAGTYYYGACVYRGKVGESDITNNCSGSVAVVVSN